MESGKHCGKKRNYSFWAISSFVTMFSKSCLLQSRHKVSIWVKGLNWNDRQNRSKYLAKISIIFKLLKIIMWTIIVNICLIIPFWNTLPFHNSEQQLVLFKQCFKVCYKFILNSFSDFTFYICHHIMTGKWWKGRACIWSWI